MRTSLFEVPSQLPKVPDEITIYQTQILPTASKNTSKSLLDRLSPLKNLFRIKGKAKDLGDRTTIHQGTRSLQVYHSSDSFWYAEDLQLPSHPPLPTPKPTQDIRKSAADLLHSLQLLSPELRYADAGATLWTQCDAQKNILQQITVEQKVRFAFFLDHRPVFGPGAKASIAFDLHHKVSQFFYFWRKVEPVATRRLISPAAALNVLQADGRFAELQPDTAKVRIHSIELGQYALPPYLLQRFLLPVYAVRGTVSTARLPRHDFTLRVAAVEPTSHDFEAGGLYGTHGLPNVF
jgi:hypothetical protein